MWKSLAKKLLFHNDVILTVNTTPQNNVNYLICGCVRHKL